MAATAGSSAAVEFMTSKYVTGLEPVATAEGDFNHDGKVDIVTANFHDGTVGVLLGKGNGTFKPVLFSEAGSYPQALAVGDFNGDGKEDLLVIDEAAEACCSASSVVFLPGNGDGTFGAPVTIATFPTVGLNLATSVVAADFNGDGKLDFAVAIGSNQITDEQADPGEVILFLGQGNGTFQQSTILNTTGYPYTLTVADLNKDGTPDLVVNNITYYGTSLWVYLGNGDGTFKSPIRNAPLYDNALSVVVADMNGDGNLDLIAGAEYGLFVILGNGNGTFQNPGPYAAGYGTGQVVVADFNGDGLPDVAMPDFNVGLDILLNAGYGTGGLGVPTFYSLPGATPNTELAAIGVASFSGQLPGSADILMTDAAGESYGTGFDVYLMRNLGATKMTLSASPKTSQPGQTVTFTAKVTGAVKGAGQPTGSITFENGSTKLGTVTLVNGVVTLQYSELATGSQKIVAVYSGDSYFNAATSATLTEKVK
ncbi:MAG: FG-GAP-like repeat-containing protein [Terriglobales bacterium]|jgi:hypothetical protein